MTREERRPLLLAQLLGVAPDEAQAILKALDEVRGEPGAIAEFGVAQGYTSALMSNEIRDEDTELHLFDSFQGLPAPAPEDKLLDDIFKLGTIEAYAGQMKCPREWVEARLREVEFPRDRYFVHEGFVADTLRETATLPAVVKFAFVDLDLYEGMRDALQWLGGATLKGAQIIADDYGFFSSGAKTAVDEFLATRPWWRMEVCNHFARMWRVG